LKTTNILFFLLVIILTSIACQTPADISDPTRVAIVQTAQPYFATPTNWQDAPSACFSSLTQVGYTIENAEYLSSGSVIEIENIKWKEKDYFLYYILTTNHTDEGFKMGSTVSLTAGFNGRLKFKYTTVDSLVITDSLGRKADGSIVAIIGESRAITPLNEQPLPVMPENLISGIGLPRNQVYYAMGYPMGSWLPQFVKAQVSDSPKDAVTLYTVMTMRITDDSQTVSVSGMSGGPMCNSLGQIAATVSSTDGNLKDFFVTPLPHNISEQYSLLKSRVNQIIQSP